MDEILNDAISLYLSTLHPARTCQALIGAVLVFSMRTELIGSHLKTQRTDGLSTPTL